MDTKLLRNFIAIVEQGSMTAAAKKLYVAQPALSNQLRVLEKELGARLLERTSRRQELTPAGQALYRQAKLMVSLENAVKQEVRDQRDGAAGTLRIALNPSTAITLLDGWLLEFAQCYPNVRYELYEVDSFEVVKLLESGVVDVGVARTPCHLTPAMEARFMPGEQMVAAYHKEAFAFPVQGSFITLKELSAVPICVVRRYEQLVVDACENSGFEPGIICTSNQLSTSLHWARAGLAVAIVPLTSFDCIEDPHLRYKVISEPSFATKRAVITMKSGHLSDPGRLFSAFCDQKLVQIDGGNSSK